MRDEVRLDTVQVIEHCVYRCVFGAQRVKQMADGKADRFAIQRLQLRVRFPLHMAHCQEHVFSVTDQFVAVGANFGFLRVRQEFERLRHEGFAGLEQGLDFEPQGQPSRWVTLRTCRVLKLAFG